MQLWLHLAKSNSSQVCTWAHTAPATENPAVVNESVVSDMGLVDDFLNVQPMTS